jgi:hypothetical protein
MERVPTLIEEVGIDHVEVARRLIFSVREVPADTVGRWRRPTDLRRTKDTELATPLMARPQQVRVRVSS